MNVQVPEHRCKVPHDFQADAHITPHAFPVSDAHGDFAQQFQKGPTCLDLGEVREGISVMLA